MSLYIGSNRYKPMLNGAKASFIVESQIKPVQLVINGDFSNGTSNWSRRAATISASDGVLSIQKTSTGSGGFARHSPAISLDTQHLYYIRCQARIDDVQNSYSATVGFFNSTSIADGRAVATRSTTWESIDIVSSPVDTANTFSLRCGISSTPVDSIAYFKNVILIDLTETFGSGNEPDINECRSIFTNDYYEYYDPNA